MPAPFSFEKHGFNPHLIRGHFDFDVNSKARVIASKKSKKRFEDKKGHAVS